VRKPFPAAVAMLRLFAAEEAAKDQKQCHRVYLLH
jgi:hypothetical protein